VYNRAQLVQQALERQVEDYERLMTALSLDLQARWGHNGADLLGLATFAKVNNNSSSVLQSSNHTEGRPDNDTQGNKVDLSSIDKFHHKPELHLKQHDRSLSSIRGESPTSQQHYQHRRSRPEATVLGTGMFGKESYNARTGAIGIDRRQTPLTEQRHREQAALALVDNWSLWNPT